MNTPLLAGIATAIVVFALGLYLVIKRNRRIDNQLRLSSERQTRSNAAITAIMGLPLEQRVRLASVALSFSDVGKYKMAKACPAELETPFKHFANFAVICVSKVNFNRVTIHDVRQYNEAELANLYTLMANDMEFLRVCIWMSDFLDVYLTYFLHEAYAEDKTPNGDYSFMPDRDMYNGDLVFYMQGQREHVLPNNFIRTMETTVSSTD
jgi:hypothetical protein